MPKKPSKKPRRQLQAEARRKFTSQKRNKDEFHNCDVPGCPNVVSVADLPKSFSGPIFCILHRNGHD